MKKALISSLVTLAAAASTLSGATYALFISEDSVNIAITSGSIKASATIDNLVVYSGQWNDVTKEYDSKEQDTLVFANGGIAEIKENILILERITPMDKVTFDIEIKNLSNIKTLYRPVVKSAPLIDTRLYDQLEILIEGTLPSDAWSPLDIGAELTIGVSIELPYIDNYTYEGLSAALLIGVELVQANANLP